MKFSLKIIVALVLSCVAAFAQSGQPIKQSGNTTPTHVFCVTTNGIAQDCGTAAIPFATTFGTWGTGPTNCAWTALVTSGAAQKICLGGTTSGGAEIYVQNYGSAPAQPLTLNLNGTLYQFPFTGMGAGNVVGPNSSTVGDLVVWNNTAGTLVKDSNVLPNGTVATTQTESDSSTKVATDAFVQGRTVYPNNTFFGSGMPWIDARSGSNGCAAAVGDDSTDDEPAIQCQLTYLHNTGVGGQVAGKLYLPCGGYYISTGLTVYSGTQVEGESARCVVIDTHNNDITAITFPASVGGNDFTFLEHLIVSGSTSTVAANSLVIVGSNHLVNMDDVQLVGGLFALENHGVDGHLYGVYGCGTNTTSGGCVAEYGANWYIRDKFDGTAHYSFYVGVGGAGHEISCVTCDFSGTFTYALYVNDGGMSPRANVNIGGGSIIGGPVDIVSAQQVNITGSEVGSTVTTASPLALSGNYGGTTVTGSGAVTCSANIGINCPSTLGAVTFATLPSSPATGEYEYITDGKASNCGDSACTTWGTTITGGTGSLKLFTWYNGSNWTLVGK